MTMPIRVHNLHNLALCFSQQFPASQRQRPSSFKTNCLCPTRAVFIPSAEMIICWPATAPLHHQPTDKRMNLSAHQARQPTTFELPQLMKFTYKLNRFVVSQSVRQSRAGWLQMIERRPTGAAMSNAEYSVRTTDEGGSGMQPRRETSHFQPQHVNS